VGARAFEVASGEILHLGELTEKNSQPRHDAKPTAKSGKVRVAAAEKVEWRIWGEEVWRKGSGEAASSPGACRLDWRSDETVQQRLVVVDEAQPLILTLSQMTEVLVEPTTDDQMFVGPKREGASRLGDVAVLTNEKSDIVGWKRLEKAAEKISRIIEPTMPLVSFDPLAMASKTAPFRNSLGMKFVPVPGTQVLMCIHETRNVDYAAYARAKGGVDDHLQIWTEAGNAQHPAVAVNYEDAQGFCRWLSTKEGSTYRLPTDSEWSAAVGKMTYPWGNSFPPGSQDGNYDAELAHDGYERTAPVMSFRANELGIYDMGGNAWEWCSTWYTTGLNDAPIRREYPFLDDDRGGKAYRVQRGASWLDNENLPLRSSCRNSSPPSRFDDRSGFRCVLVVGGG
jgi:formylglycine-generating enzyme required for sulfatase activity